MLGIPLIKQLVEKFDDLIIMPGGGINENNLRQILMETKAKEFHGSARSVQESKMTFKNEKCRMGSDSNDYSIQVTSTGTVIKMVEIFKEYMNS